MELNARYSHTNLVAKDWRRLAAFYEEVFGCVAESPERKLQGVWLEAGTGIPGARVRGVHVKLPGYERTGPTLEIFQYDHVLEAQIPAPNRPGYGHIAFVVDDVDVARETVVAAGGGIVGEIVSSGEVGARTLRWAYVRDPEGNIIELQQWSA